MASQSITLNRRRHHELSLDLGCAVNGDADDCTKRRKELPERVETVIGRWKGQGGVPNCVLPSQWRRKILRKRRLYRERIRKKCWIMENYAREANSGVEEQQQASYKGWALRMGRLL